LSDAGACDWLMHCAVPFSVLTYESDRYIVSDKASRDVLWEWQGNGSCRCPVTTGWLVGNLARGALSGETRLCDFAASKSTR
jgi:hypothetical protein